VDTREFDEILQRTLDDGALSRSEERALRWVIRDLEPDARERAVLRSRAFAAADLRIGSGNGPGLLEWLHKIVNVIEARAEKQDTFEAAALFSPGEACPRRIVELFDGARARVDVCVFTITDDRITGAILRAHERGVNVRLVSDNDKTDDLGSDVNRLAASGIPCVLDATSSHMHHKFAVFDSRTLLFGSYNWTRSAAQDNEEDLVVVRERGLVSSFLAEFERLWERYGNR
jgi:phosphatidylserine/phosphatidylglycerophosphate/cardiolipin synthase-like enzyme